MNPFRMDAMMTSGAAQPQPEQQPEPELLPQPQPEPQPELQPEPQPEPELQPEPEPVAQAQPPLIEPFNIMLRQNENRWLLAMRNRQYGYGRAAHPSPLEARVLDVQENGQDQDQGQDHGQGLGQDQDQGDEVIDGGPQPYSPRELVGHLAAWRLPQSMRRVLCWESPPLSLFVLAMGMMFLFSLDYTNVVYAVSITGVVILLSVVLYLTAATMQGSRQVERWVYATLREPLMSSQEVDALLRGMLDVIKRWIATGNFLVWQTSLLQKIGLVIFLWRLYTMCFLIDFGLLAKFFYVAGFTVYPLAHRACAEWHGIVNRSIRFRLLRNPNRVCVAVVHGTGPNPFRDAAGEARRNENQDPTIGPIDEELNGGTAGDTDPETLANSNKPNGPNEEYFDAEARHQLEQLHI